jgi:CRP/FNR family transcriptional regulator
MERRPDAWILRDSGFLDRLRDDERAAFRRICPDRTFAPGDVIFREGDAADAMHVVARGRVKLVRTTPDGGERILGVVGPDDLIGEAFVGDGARYRLDAVAATDVVTCPMSREQYRRLAREAPRIVESFTEMLTENLFRCRDRLTEGHGPIRARVAAVLIDHARRFGDDRADRPGWVDVDVALGHEELAAMVGATRVSVSTAIADLRRAGRLDGTRGRYALDVGGLTRVVEGDDAEG